MLGEGADFESLNVETHKRLHKCSEIIRKRDLRVGDKKLNAISSTAGPEQVISMKLLQSKLKDNHFVQNCFRTKTLTCLNESCWAWREFPPLKDRDLTCKFHISNVSVFVSPRTTTSKVLKSRASPIHWDYLNFNPWLRPMSA